jgi:hypothetical protein
MRLNLRHLGVGAFVRIQGRCAGARLAATFARRGTEIPTKPPDALTRPFAEDPLKQKQLDAFTRDVAFQPGTLNEVVESLADFLMPDAAVARVLKTG